MPRRKIMQIGIIVFLLFGLAITSTSTFSFWREVTVTRTIEVIGVGEPLELEITDLSTDNDPLSLVPSGYVVTISDTDEITLQYTVGVSRELLSTEVLNIYANTVLIGDDDTYSHLVDIDILGMGNNAILDLYNDVITITVTIKLIEPIDEAEAIANGLDMSLVNVEDSILAYNQIKEKTISFILTFNLQIKESIE
ncbi:MAG: hypothetical protein KAH13_05290 [Tenericutes bacterium]|nr:hypothetical protein [Mycoplasmatota bacterium]